jgi:integrase
MAAHQHILISAGPQHRKTKRRPWIARWTLNGTSASRSFETKAQAADFLSDLRRAHRDGGAFDSDTKLPASWGRGGGGTTVAAWCLEWLARRWGHVEPKTRRSVGEALARLIGATVQGTGPAPTNAELFAWVSAAALGDTPPGGPLTKTLARRSLPLAELDARRAALAAERVTRRLDPDGRVSPATNPLGTDTANRHRKNIVQCLRDAQAEGLLQEVVWPELRVARTKKERAAAVAAIDTDALPTHHDALGLVGQMRTRQASHTLYQTMSFVALYTGALPSEVRAVEVRDLDLPDEGWGELRVREAVTDAGDRWTGDDEVHGDPKTGRRHVPIPPALVVILAKYLKDRDITAGRVFRTRTGGVPTLSNWGRALHRVDGSLYPYLFRHVAATTMLVNRVAPGEVARRLGTSIETLRKVYEGVFKDEDTRANAILDSVYGDGQTWLSDGWASDGRTRVHRW